MNYEEWLAAVPEQIRADPLWDFQAYPKAFFEEGFGRGFGKEYAYFQRIASGSARETRR